MNDPDRIEYLTENGAVANRFPFPLGVRFADAFPLAQTLLRSDYPHTVRVLTQGGDVVCQWSKEDERLAA